MRIRLSSGITDDKVVDNAPRVDTTSTVSREFDRTEHGGHGGDGGGGMRLCGPFLFPALREVHSISGQHQMLC